MIKYQQIINGHSISIRFVGIDDAAVLMELNNDKDIAKYVVGNPRQVTLEEQLRWMDKIKDEACTKRFIIEYDSMAVGTLIISDIDMLNSTGNINIKLLSSARGKGVGKQSIKLGLKYCFEELGLRCITAHVLDYNKASLALFESCGFTNEGILRSRVIKNGERHDLVSFSILFCET